jgi:hypothetical protein
MRKGDALPGTVLVIVTLNDVPVDTVAVGWVEGTLISHAD